MIQGRRRELGILEATLERAFVDHAQALLLVGDAGMGKSALLDALARWARRQGVRVVRASAPQGSEATPFAVIEDLARGLPDALSQLPAGDAEALSSLTRAASARPGVVAVALLHLIGEAAHARRLVMLVDDLHWADAGSLTALCLAVGRLQSEQVAVVAAARPRPPLDRRLRSWPTLDVGPLDSASAVEVLRAALPEGPVLPEGRARTVVSALGCCPLAIVEAPRLLSVEQLAGTASLPDPLPLDDRLTLAWGTAWAGLPDRAGQALLALCVARGSGPLLVARLWADLGLRADDLSPARAARLVSRSGPAGTADLAHPLIRDAILATAGPDRVRGMHLVAARAAEAIGLPPSVVIAHQSAAASPGDRRAVVELERSADRALADDLGESAVQALVAAAALADGAERSRLAARAARARTSQSAGYTGSEQILGLADPSTLPLDDRLWVEWLRAESLGNVSLRQHLIALDAATGLARRAGSPLSAWTLMSAIDAAWRLQDRAAVIAHAEALLDWLHHDYREPGALVPAWVCRVWYGVTEFQVGHVAAAHDLLTAARQESRTWHAPDDLALTQELSVLMADGHMSYPDPWVDTRLAEAARRNARDPGETLGVIRRFQAERAHRRGDLAQARALVEDSLAMTRAAGSRQGTVVGLVTAAAIAAVQGDRVAHDCAAAEAVQLAQANGDRTLGTRVARAAGLLALGEGRLDEALAQLEPLTEDLLLGYGPWDAVPMGRGDLVEALVRCGEVDRAGRVAADLARTLGPSADPAARAVVDRVRGLTVGDDQGATALAAAIDGFRAAGDPFEAGRTRLLLGTLLRRERLVQQARHELRLAAADLDRIGAAPWADQARAELRATGASVPHRAADPWAALTPQERRVAAAVASGATDRQVAADLFLSPRTVGYHLASVYRKLGLTGRTALARALADAREDQAGPG